jgi:hypothetical protein
MLLRLFFDLEQGPAEILDHLNDPLPVLDRGEAQLSVTRHDDIFLAPHEHRPSAAPGEDELARPEHRAARGRLEASGLFQLHQARNLAHPP